MSLRSWIIRGTILAGLAVLAACGWVASSWVSPERVRSQVLAQLGDEFTNVSVHVGSARMRILGGIAVTDIRLTRHGDDTPFLVVPSAVLYHDKEQLNRGRLVIKKIELDKPELYAERGPDGQWNLAGVIRPTPADRPVPTFVIRGGTVHVTDRSPEPLPPLTATELYLTLLNDPLPVLAVQSRCELEGFGPVGVRARINRISRAVSMALEMPAFPLGEVAPVAAEKFAPELARHLTGLKATAALSADLTYKPEASVPWRYDVRVTVKDARFTHPVLPWPAEHLTATARLFDGRFRIEEATAELNGAKLRFAFETRPPRLIAERPTAEMPADRPGSAPSDSSLALPVGGTLVAVAAHGDTSSGSSASDSSSVRRSARSPVQTGTDASPDTSPDASPDTSPDDDDAELRRLETYLQRAELTATHVLLDDALFDSLPEVVRDLRQQFSPVGRIDFGYRFVREPQGWKRELELRPRQLTVTYEKFRYPVGDLRGWVKRIDTPRDPPTTTIDLIGTAAGQPITIKGQVVGPGPDPGINLRVSGANVPLDEAVISALPPRYVDLVRRFRAGGRGDFVAEILQRPGVNLCENEFRIDIREASLNHTELPYPLEKVKGRLVIRTTATDPSRPLRPGEPLQPPPDRDEIVLDGFTAVHAGAAVWLNGSKRPIPNSRDHKITLHVGANNAPADDDLRAAFAALNIESVWTVLRPRGRITFSADLELIDRAGPPGQPDADPKVNPATDLRLTFSFSGPTINPTFLPYELTDLSGWLEYKNGRAELAHFAARHGETRVKLAAAEIRFYPGGVIWANLGGLEAKPFLPDADLVRALPARLGSAIEELRLKGQMELIVKHLVVLTPTAGREPSSPAPAGRSPAVARGQAPLADTPAAARVGTSQPAAPTVPPRSLPRAPICAAADTSAATAAAADTSAATAAAGEPDRGLQPLTPASDVTLYWDAELRLAGAAFDTGVAWEQVFGAVGCRGRYEGDHLGLLRGAVWFDRAVVARQPVSRLSCRIRAAPQQPDPARSGEYLPGELEFTDITGDLFHGTLGGEARVILTEPVRFDLWLTATDVQLEEVARHYKLGSDADLKGIAQAQVRLLNRPDPRTGRLVVEGAGKIDVPTGRMYNLPILLDLVKVLKLQTPDKTAFEEAHATFRVRGDRIKVEQIDLIGKAVCLGGSGELDTSGEYVRFDFYTVGSQVLARMINTPVGDLTAFLSKNLFVIKMTRENGELKYKPEAVPLVTEPVRAVADRLRARAARLFGG